MDIIKETIIEYIENIYALGINYLKGKNNIELKNLLKELTLFEDKIEICDDESIIRNYKLMVENLTSRVEVIINE